MGLSIHYNGAFKKGASLSAMIEEVKDIAEVYDWEYNVYNDTFDEDALGKTAYTDEIFGINFTPTNCETVCLEFLSNGKLTRAINLRLFGKNSEEPKEEFLYLLSVKTQFAGIEIHKLLIHLFKYLNEKYFTNFEMIDEGQYWETGDEKLLEEIFARYVALLDSFSLAIETLPMNSDESFDIYFARLMDQIQDRRNKKNDENS